MFYLSAVETFVNVVFNWVPMPLTAAAITIDIICGSKVSQLK